MRTIARWRLLIAIACGVLPLAACGDEQLPTSPDVAVEPFIVGSPPQFAGAQPPAYVGRWLGVVTHTGCRDVVADRCRPLPDPAEAPWMVRLELSQAGAQLSGTLEYGTRGPYAFTGYISTTLGIAGSATPGSQVTILRLDRSGNDFTGVLVTETREADGRLLQTQKYDVTVPLSRPLLP